MDSNGDDPQTLLISTLRSQISDLFTQVTQLNGKLVQSYDRVSDLEDEIHSSSLSLRQASVKVSQLELERTQHLSALNTGLLVEKEVVTQELTRLMEKATEEAASRGLAESAKTQIEKELDDLSASLFSQANTMVAEARFARSLAEEKARSAEVMLKGAEEAVGVMQGEVRRLVEEKENKEKELERLRGRGKYRAEEMSSERVMMRTGNVGYTEFLAFVGHLRTLKATKATHPTMNTLLGLPFLARLMNEDSDPTIRLDLAPSLNWLSRRTVLAAIHNGNLTIEPVQTAVLLQQLSSSISSGPSTLTTTSTTGGVCCALCGSALFASDAGHHHENQGQATSTRSNSIPNVPVIGGINGIGIGSTWFKRPSTPSNATTGTPTPPPSPPPPHLHSNAKGVEVQLPTQVYIFRVTNTSATGSSAGVSSGSLSVSIPKPSSFSTTQAPPPPARTGRGRSGTVSQSPAPAPSSSQSNSHSGTLGIPNLNSNTNTIGGPGGPIYPLCTSNYCLARLRATCSLWAFVRVGVVTAVWEEAEELGSSPTTSTNRLTPPPTHPSHPSAVPPAIPPRRRGLWGTLGSLSERAAGWSSSSQSSRPGTPTAMEITEKEKGLPSVPPPPPLHPSIATATTTTTTTTTGAGAAPPPPLPKRNEGRGRRAMTPVPASVPSESESQHVTADVVKGAGTGEVVFTASPPSSPNVLPSVPKEPHLLPLPDSRPPTPQTPTSYRYYAGGTISATSTTTCGRS
ncbi:hypothetical protein BT96DRAFT_997622 [Gymnopus androsaceus JB14]|uniref:GDP/GTP exchange factor Sec2 N-terminal domain-containing protein n=1 Tax=Gymnopus androsaceus JB14 TaxID=1447944 RepID=A0A6A4HCR1_9AGAR|nr:hypothetical protein BT96DRAFT_997622 [Gymnopus androsaceus JB14]